MLLPSNMMVVLLWISYCSATLQYEALRPTDLKPNVCVLKSRYQARTTILLARYCYEKRVISWRYQLLWLHSVLVTRLLAH